MKLIQLQEARYAEKAAPSGWSSEKVISTFFVLEDQDEDWKLFIPKDGLIVYADGEYVASINWTPDGYEAQHEDDVWPIDPSELLINETRTVYGR